MKTLAELCVTKITENIEGFSALYNTTQNERLKRNFEFLQRSCAFDFANEVHRKHPIQENHVDLVINQHLRILDTSWFDNVSWKTICAKIAEIGPTVKKIYFRQLAEEKPWDQVMLHLTNVEQIFFCNECNDVLLQSIAENCEKVAEITTVPLLTANSSNFKLLCYKSNGQRSCKDLKTLTLTSKYVTKEIGQYLIQNLPSVENFIFDDLPLLLYLMHKRDFRELNKIQPYNYKWLNFFASSHKRKFSDIIKICTSLCPYATSVYCPAVKPEHLDSFSRLSDLKTLQLEGLRTGFLDINNLLKSVGSTLTSLTIVRCSLSVKTLIKSCPALKLLSLNKVPFDEEKLPEEENLNEEENLFPQCHNFASCDLSFCHSAKYLKLICFLLSLLYNLEDVTVTRDNVYYTEDVPLNICSRDYCLLESYAQTLPNKPKMTVCIGWEGDDDLKLRFPYWPHESSSEDENNEI